MRRRESSRTYCLVRGDEVHQVSPGAGEGRVQNLAVGDCFGMTEWTAFSRQFLRQLNRWEGSSVHLGSFGVHNLVPDTPSDLRVLTRKLFFMRVQCPVVPRARINMASENTYQQVKSWRHRITTAAGASINLKYYYNRCVYDVLHHNILCLKQGTLMGSLNTCPRQLCEMSVLKIIY